MSKRDIWTDYKELETFSKRLVNKLIRAMKGKGLTENQLTSVSRCIARVAKSKQEKKQPSAYITYYCEQYPKIMQKHPELSLGDAAKIIGKQWKSMPFEEKVIYHERANQAVNK